MNNHPDYILLKRILNEVDPIGLIDFDTPESLNEYEPELMEIFREDVISLDAQNLGERIYQVFVQYFNEEIAGAKDAYDLVANRFLAERK